MKLKDILTPELTLTQVGGIQTKKQILTLISTAIANVDSRIKIKRVFDALMAREQLGTTAVGFGFAIPHARLKDINHAICTVVSLQDPINFDTDDNHQPVDIIFGLIVPEQATQDHLSILADIAEHIKDPDYRKHLREATDQEHLFQAAIHSTTTH